MSLSITKLKELLESKGFYPKMYYTIDNLCIYIYIESKDNLNKFLIYIPSKYDINMKNTNIENVYKIKEIEIDNINTNNIAEKYGDNINQDELIDKYNVKEMEFKLNYNHNNLEEQLEKGYNKSIEFENREDINNVKDINRQIKRLGLTVKNIKYKLCIQYKNYLTIIRRDDSISNFIIKGINIERLNRYYVVGDLEIFYEKMETYINDINIVENNIQDILDKNQILHTNILNKFLAEKQDIINMSKNIYNKKFYYKHYINTYNLLLKDLDNIEQHVIEKNRIPNNIYSNSSSSSTELYTVYANKNEIIKEIASLKEKNHNITLSVDKIMFDNQILLDKIIKNFSELNKILTNI